MSRLVRGDARVELGPDGNAPASFFWKGRRYQVQRVLLVQKRTASWWDGAGERTCFRVVAATGDECGHFEIAHAHEEGTWTLERVLDQRRRAVTLDEAVKELEEAIKAWEARPPDEARQQRVREARAQLARLQREAERAGQLTLGDEPEE